MAKCGKGCMPECEYFTTGGCISPFNCPYKIETGYINSATSVIGSYTQGKEDLNEPKIKKWFRSLVEEGKIRQEPMNYDAATLQIYIDYLEKENAALRERLEKSVELPRVECIMTREWLSRELIGSIMFEWCALYKKGGYLMAEPCLSKEAAEIRLAELKGENE